MADRKVRTEIDEIMSSARPKKSAGRKPPVNVKASGASQVAVGDGNTQIAGNVRITTQKYDPKIAPPPGSIGADSLLRQRIEGLFNDIGLEREKRFGKTSYPAMYSTFKREFGIKRNQKWTTIFLWPVSMATEIINYLEGKMGKTIGGRIRKAAATKAKPPTRPQLYAKEKDLLEHLGMNMKSQELRQFMTERFGVTSHLDLSLAQHMQLVAFLEDQVKRTIGEAD